MRIGQAAAEGHALGLEPGPPPPGALFATWTVRNPATTAQDPVGVGEIGVRHQAGNLTRRVAAAGGRRAQVTVRRPLTGVDQTTGHQDSPGGIV